MNTDVQGATLPSTSAAEADAIGMKHPYHLVDPSPWPIVAAFGGGLMLFGIIMVSHYGNYWALGIGAAMVLFTMFVWWRDVLKESRVASMHTPVVRLGLRYGMLLFIASEVMFFLGFFWAYFHFALYPDHVSGAAHAIWPPAGIHTFNPWDLPFLNTMILLLSGCAVTWAHHSLIESDRKYLIMGLGFTVLLGLAFSTFQAIEYMHAPFAFSGGGIYPSIFFLATGFHGFHVLVGTAFLVVCWFRARGGDFSPARHFGFEAAAWYWHFVDVVWLFLFVAIYLFGAGQIHE